MSYEDFEKLCREAWKDEDYKYFYIDRSEKKSGGIYCVYIESKTLLLNVFQK